MKNRIPPPLYLLVYGALMWFVARSPYALHVDLPHRILAGWIVGLAGLALILPALRRFGAAKTTIDPLHPEASTALVTGGVYRLTRNPMYTGFLLMLAGWAIGLASLANLLLLMAFVLTLTYLQIKPEEAALAELFGDDYRAYCRKVRRWLW